MKRRHCRRTLRPRSTYQMQCSARQRFHCSQKDFWDLSQLTIQQCRSVSARWQRGSRVNNRIPAKHWIPRHACVSSHLQTPCTSAVASAEACAVRGSPPLPLPLPASSICAAAAAACEWPLMLYCADRLRASAALRAAPDSAAAALLEAGRIVLLPLASSLPMERSRDALPLARLPPVLEARWPRSRMLPSSSLRSARSVWTRSATCCLACPYKQYG
jgi:hypothetical protein